MFEVIDTKKKNNNSVVLNGETILEQFENWITEHGKTSDIIRFLGVKSAEVIRKSASGTLTEDDKDDILEFAAFFYEEYGNVTFEERMRAFDGHEPVILAIANGIAEEKWDNETKQLCSEMNDFEKNEAEKLAETLLNFRYKRRYFFAGDGCNDDIMLPRTVPKKEIDAVKHELHNMSVRVIHDRGSVIGHFYRDDIDYVFGIAVLSDGSWRPIPAEDIGRAYCMTPSGKFISPEENVQFTTFERKN